MLQQRAIAFVFQIWKVPAVMKNQLEVWNQSKTLKYFGWVIKGIPSFPWSYTTYMPAIKNLTTKHKMPMLWMGLESPFLHPTSKTDCPTFWVRKIGTFLNHWRIMQVLWVQDTGEPGGMLSWKILKSWCSEMLAFWEWLFLFTTAVTRLLF